MHFKMVATQLILLLGCFLFSPLSLMASPHGTEFGITQFQNSGGLSGSSSARPQDIDAMVFGNPATLSQWNSDYGFSAGLSYLHPDVSTTNDGSNPFIPAISADSSIDTIILPHFSFAKKLSNNNVFGFGFTSISGLMADYRQSITTTPIVSSLQIYGFGLSFGHQVNEHLSIGINTTLTGSFFQFGIASNTASINDYGFSSAFGYTYALSKLITGGYYKPAYEHKFDGLIETTPTQYDNFTLEQPEEFVLGISTTEGFSNKHLLALDVRWKKWSKAKGYESLWKDQNIISLGYQLQQQDWTYRFGYSHIGNLLKEGSGLGNQLGSVTSFNIPGTTVLPISPPLLQLLQSTATNGYWRKNLSAGLSKHFSATTEASFFLSYTFDGKETIHSGLSTDASVWALGSGWTWRF